MFPVTFLTFACVEMAYRRICCVTFPVVSWVLLPVDDFVSFFIFIRYFSWPTWPLKIIVWSSNNTGLSSSGCIPISLKELHVLDLLLWSLIWSPFTMGSALLPLTLALGSGTWEAWETLIFRDLAFSVYLLGLYTIQQQAHTFLSDHLTAADVLYVYVLLLAFVFPTGLNTS